jgi:large subunit ribosomal protein L16
VKPGKIIYEIAGVDEQTAKEALEYAASKLPIPTKIVSRSSFGGEAV